MSKKTYIICDACGKEIPYHEHRNGGVKAIVKRFTSPDHEITHDGIVRQYDFCTECGTRFIHGINYLKLAVKKEELSNYPPYSQQLGDANE